MKRKYAENEEFKRLVDEAIMKCGGDESLDIFASDQNKGDTGRFRFASYASVEFEFYQVLSTPKVSLYIG